MKKLYTSLLMLLSLIMLSGCNDNYTVHGVLTDTEGNKLQNAKISFDIETTISVLGNISLAIFKDGNNSAETVDEVFTNENGEYNATFESITNSPTLRYEYLDKKGEKALSLFTGDNEVNIIVGDNNIYTVYGTVVDSQGIKLVGAEISFDSVRGTVGIFKDVNTSTETVEKILTDENGNYSATFFTTSNTVTLVCNYDAYRESRTASKSISFDTKKINADILIEDTPYTTHSYLRGKVTDTSGNPIANVTVGYSIIDNEFTDENGEYKIALLQKEQTLIVEKYNDYKGLTLDMNYTDDVDHTQDFILEKK